MLDMTLGLGIHLQYLESVNMLVNSKYTASVWARKSRFQQTRRKNATVNSFFFLLCH